MPTLGATTRKGSRMKTLVTIIALLLAATFVTPSPAAAQDLDCDAIGGYFDEVDATMAKEIHAVVTSPGWAEDARDITEVMNAAGSSTEDVDAADIQPLLELFSVPSTVLTGMDEETIPNDALALHESAIGFWDTIPGWIGAELDGDDDAWEASMADLAAYAKDNGAAQAAIDAACPGLIDGYMGNVEALGSLFDGLDGAEGTPVALAQISPEDLDGIGVYFLIMPAGMGGAFAEPATVAAPEREPATVRTVDPDSTPVATPGS